MSRYADPEEVHLAKERAAGPLGRELGQFPLQFARPARIGSLPGVKENPMLRNGKATLVRLSRRQFAVTCCHVLDLHLAIPRCRAYVGSRLLSYCRFLRCVSQEAFSSSAVVRRGSFS
jgi:hypothetical protein